MYLSIKNCFKLDEIIKSFEVGYRSYITSELKKNYPTLNDFSIAVNSINDSLNSSTLILSHKYKAKILKIKNEIATYYKRIEDCTDAYNTKNYHKDVPYVSEIIDYVMFFFNSCFQNLAKGYTSIEEFKDYTIKYSLIRNWLSHPASSNILIQTAKEVVSFIRKVISNLDDSYFWYVEKKEILNTLELFTKNIDETPLNYHNLSEVSFGYKKLVCRENELRQISELLFGKDQNYRKSGSLVIFGYGGVGKTALILEFLYRTIKDIYDEKLIDPIEFILFYTAKEEVLAISQTSGDIYINEINKQIKDFDDFEVRLKRCLEIEKLEKLKDKRGIIVIDNFETISEKEKEKFYDFIRRTPRTIQFIITSRNEEQCEDKLNLKEYYDIDEGVKFIDEYVDANDFRLNLSENSRQELVQLSKGNTLVLVLTIQLINYGIDVSSILYDLRNVESSNVEVIADFMYKNTINNSIESLEKEGYKPIDVLKVISLYDVPIDLYSISYLASQEINSVEHICKSLAKKLVLEKQGETYSPNEFANKFIITKYLPNNIEKKEIKRRIRDYQKDLNSKLEKLKKVKERQPLLNEIMEDWKPKNSIDTIAIAETFSLFGASKAACETENIDTITNIRKEFQRIEKMTSHPYIKFQKARCHELYLKVFEGEKNKNKIKEIISNSFEEAIESTDFYYPYIKNTKSYGSINWIYGLFLSNTAKDNEKALRYIEDAIQIFRRLNIQDKVYFTAINNLSWIYSNLYESKGDKRYLSELKALFFEVIKNRTVLETMDFDYRLYLRNFSKYFPKKEKHNS